MATRNIFSIDLTMNQETKDYCMTSKENEVLKRLSIGLSYKMIATDMGISYFTVNNHIKSIYNKMGVHSMGEAIFLVYKFNLV